MTGLTWANHPNAELRLRLADYLGRGWTIVQLTPDAALLARPKHWTKPARPFINPFHLLSFWRGNREDRIRLAVAPDGGVVETRA